MEVERSVEIERAALAERLARLGVSSCGEDRAGPSEDADDEAEDVRSLFEVGEAVEARWRRGEIWYRGKVAGVSSRDGECTVAYDDGTVESVPASLLRRDARRDAPSRGRDAVRADIVRWYAAHNPTKLPTVDVLLQRCGEGNEEALLDAIRKKYEDAAGRARAVKAEVEALYTRHNPAKLAGVDALLARCAGSEAALLDAIRRKYEGDSYNVDVSDEGDSDGDSDGEDSPSLDRAVEVQQTPEAAAALRCERVAAIREILASEEAFFAVLTVVDARYAAALRSCAAASSVALDLVALVNACDTLRALSASLRGDLAEEVKRGAAAAGPAGDDLDGVCLGRVFARYGPFLKMFATYAQRFAETRASRVALRDALLLTALSDDAAAASKKVGLAAKGGARDVARAIVALDRAPPRGQRSGDGAAPEPLHDRVETHLAAPLHRVTKYERSLRRIADATPADHADQPSLATAIAQSCAAMEHIRATLQADSAFKRLVAFRPLAATVLLDAPMRSRLMRDGTLDEVVAGRPAKTRRVWLLTDRLLVGHRSRARLLRDIPIDAVEAVRLRGDDAFELVVFGGELRITLVAADADAAAAWVSAIAAVLAARPPRDGPGPPPGPRPSGAPVKATMFAKKSPPSFRKQATPAAALETKARPAGRSRSWGPARFLAF
ncbi:hypothetical protein M885DRAFT_612771 [Pelagophyceae sp. CCMP2097]|nr:hypothetical protein M885DRAFT_612771 [Pelagophyceae sp. CCMP2097]